MSKISTDPEEIDWEDIILRLTAFTRSWVKGRAWFRGSETQVFLEGKDVDDYVFAAIGRYLEDPDKFDPAKGELLQYLKYNLVRGFVSNDLSKKENLTSTDIFAKDAVEDDDGDDNIPYSERVMPFTAALFPEEMDFAAMKDFIEAEIQGDKDAENILLGVYTLGMKRREIIEEFNLTPAQYDNGMRRLNTVINKTATHFHEKRSTA